MFFYTHQSLPSNFVSLNHKLKHLASNGFFEEALTLYQTLRASAAKPDHFSFPYILKACAGLSAVDEGISIHTHIMKTGYSKNLIVLNSLVAMYSQFGSSDSARLVFGGMIQRNSVTWNLMISGYGSSPHPKLALELRNTMRKEGVALDLVGLKIVLPICGHVKALVLGESIHAHVLVSGLSSNTPLMTAILDMYSKCGELEAAEKVFDEILWKDVVSWNALISGYAQRGRFEVVLVLFYKMIAQGLKPSIPTVLLLLQACTHLSVLQLGMAIHGYVTKLGFGCDVSIKGLVIDMYSKSGALSCACGVFCEISRGDVSSWSCMIHGLGMHGCGKAVLMVFFRMLKAGIRPDGICFLLVLSSCSHGGLIEEGRKMFDYMVSEFGIEPKMEHYASMVDLIGRAGCIEEAFRFMCKMPIEPDKSVVGAFIGACRIHGHLEMGKVFGKWLVESGWTVAGFYKLLVSIYAGEGLWDKVISIRRLMEEKKLRGVSGCSLIEGK